MSSLQCRDISALMKALEKAWPNRLEALGVLLGEALERMGRISISKQMGITERRVRTIKNALARCRVNDELWEMSVEAFLRKVMIWKRDIDGKKAIAVYPLELEILRRVENRVVLTRDLIVIETRRPGELEVIGVRRGDEIIVPGLPRELAESYRAAFHSINVPRDSVVVLWGKYPGIIAEVSLLISLSVLCEESLEKV